jgi:biotin carboxyl carrier protein
MTRQILMSRILRGAAALQQPGSSAAAGVLLPSHTAALCAAAPVLATTLPLLRGFHWTPSSLASLQVKVPPLGESISDGTVAGVLKSAGDAVEEDEPIVQIETDKVTVDVRAPKAGVIEAILVRPLLCRLPPPTARPVLLLDASCV